MHVFSLLAVFVCMNGGFYQMYVYFIAIVVKSTSLNQQRCDSNVESTAPARSEYLKKSGESVKVTNTASRKMDWAKVFLPLHDFFSPTAIDP